MRVPRDRVSIAEVLSTDSAVLEKIIEFYDPSVGEFYFLKDAPDKAHFITEEFYDDEENTLKVRNELGEVDNDYYGSALPLFSAAAAMMDILQQHCQVEIRTYSMKKWFVILDGAELVQPEEDDDLISLLWRVLQKVHLEYPV